ncbi:MAG: response regulator [Proteobacteria bacterium]|jgi:two-component system OmpR family response regulator|nr:response regulator [Pseudomonadota bacterium]MDA1302465.1 response regulator [Pseudomonadota bacterium]
MIEEPPLLLVVDDDQEIRELLKDYLSGQGYRVLTAPDGREADHILTSNDIDLIILDLMLPGEDGLSICRRIRATSRIPVIILTAKGDDMDRIIGIEMGADDYLPKPFNPRELVARIKAVLWRTRHGSPGIESGQDDKRLSFDGFTVNASTRELTDPGGEMIRLSSGEFDLLWALANNARKTLSRDEILDLTQGKTLDDPEDRSIDMLVARLRRKIEADPRIPRLIKTVRGIGYIFTASVQRP